MYAPDPTLGWRNRPGEYDYPAYEPDAPRIHATYLADGSRRTTPRELQADVRVAFVGASFTQGWGLSDGDTMAWKVQARWHDVRVVNYGTAGYGTYQSLGLLEEVLGAPDAPRVVLYGLEPMHEQRNVASAEWLRGLALGSRSGQAALPFVTLDAAGRLVEHQPTRYPAWPLRTLLASVAFAEDLFVRARAAERTAQATKVTLELIAAMDRLCAQHGARLVVVFLWSPPGARVAYRIHDFDSFRTFDGVRYQAFLEARRIPYVDCSHEITPDLVIPGDGHPNARLNDWWARCIVEKITIHRPEPRR